MAAQLSSADVQEVSILGNSPAGGDVQGAPKSADTPAQPQEYLNESRRPPTTSRSPSSSGKRSIASTGKSNITEHHFLAPDARHGGSYGQNGAANSTLTRWDSALGNIEDAKVAFDILRRSIEDAVYLDEEAYKQVTPTMQFTKVIQAQHRKIEQLEADLRSTKMQLQESNSIQIEALQRHAEMQQELENNAGELGGNVVFKMHYQELMSKEDEIQKLTAVIQVLSQQ